MAPMTNWSELTVFSIPWMIDVELSMVFSTDFIADDRVAKQNILCLGDPADLFLIPALHLLLAIGHPVQLILKLLLRFGVIILELIKEPVLLHP